MTPLKLLKKLPRHTFLILLLITGANTLNAEAQNERITIKNKTITTGDLMRSIEAQTNLKFAYSYSTLDTMSVMTLPDDVRTVREALDYMVADKNIKYVVQGRYIAFVPTYKVDRPQVHTPLQRTNDVYRESDNDGDATPVLRPDKPESKPLVEKQTTAAAPKPKPSEPAPAPYSQYTRLDRYSNIQTSFPRFAVKSNLLYGGVALAPNIAFEFATAQKQTVEISGSYNGWRRDDNDPKDNKQLVHSIFRAEYRWWLCERYNGHFFGAHAFYSRFHISGKDVPLLFDKENRYNGYGYGIGATYGYSLPINKRWGVEFNIGLGAAYLKYDKYTCDACDRKAIDADKWYFGPTRAGVTLVFLIK